MLHMFHFDLKYDDDILDLSPALEKYNQFRFIREQHIFKAAHLGTRISNLDSKFQLGYGSILHMVDNFMYDEHSDTPRVDDFPLITNEEYRKFIYHNKDFNLDGPMSFEDKYIYRPAGVNSSFMKFRTEQLTKFRYMNSLKDIPLQKEALTIINHNPLTRAFVQGRLKFYRKVQLVLSSIINTALTLPEDKLQYVHIPLSNHIYTKDTFLKSKQGWDISSIRYPESFHWIVMAHLLNLWDSNCDNSWFEAIPKDKLKMINFVLTVKDEHDNWNAIFYNLEEIAKLNTKNNLYLRIVNHLNTLAALGTSAITDNKVKDLPIEITAPTEVNSTSDTKVKVPDTSDIVNIKDDKVEKVLNDIAEIQEKKDPIGVTIPVTPSAIKSPLTKISSSIKNIVGTVRDPAYVPRNGILAVSNIPTVKNPKTDTIMSNQLMISREQEAHEFIDLQDITPKQKERCKRLADMYKGISVNGRSIEEILITDQDMSIPEVKVNDNTIPDKSMTKSRVMGFDEAYMKQTFLRDLVSTASSFSSQGMYLTDFNVKPIVNELNRANTYTLKYEEFNGKKHTVKFTLPMVDPDGTCLINGTKKTLKKQILNLPICKVSDTRVSLASNYNKTIVERNVAKAHSYLPFITKLIDMCPNKSISFGSVNINEKISYEYTVLATKYRDIVLKLTNSDTIQLNFDYYQRTIKVQPDRQDRVNSYEKKYGTYLGQYNRDVYLFIDSDNHITWCDLTGEIKGVYPTSILGIIKTYYQDVVNKKMGMVTEWTDLKILDKKFPIIFILAYRYGLTETLKHLGIKFELLSKRSNTIISDIDTSLIDNFEKINHLASLDALGLKTDDCIIGASTAAVLYGAVNTNTDIDICMSQKLVNKLLAKKLIKPYDDTTNKGRYTSIDGNVDINVIGTGLIDWDIDEWYAKSSEYMGYRWMTKDALIELYMTLYDKLGMDKHRDILQSLMEDSIAMERLGVDGVPTKLPKYFHITPRDLGKEVTLWAKVPNSVLDENKPHPNGLSKNREDRTIPRVCVSTSINGAVISLYRVYFDKFKKNNATFTDFYVYGYDGPRSSKQIVHTEELTRERLVYDAHVTNETWITENTRMRKIGVIRVYNQVKFKVEYTEFDAKFNAKKHSTQCMKWEWIKAKDAVVAAMESLPNTKYQIKADDIVIPFKDCRLVFNRYPLKHSLILAGLDMFDTSKYEYDSFDNKDTYYSLLSDRGIRINYLKGIDAFFNLFIDDITKDVLEQMSEPTNVRDLLIRSTELLTTLDHVEASSMTNCRVRSFEQFNAIVYNEMARSLAAYRVKNTKGNTFSINPEAVYQRIIKNESFLISEKINPIHDLKEKVGVTYSGMGGRTSQSFVVNDRRYARDAVGILSEATVDSGKVALNAFLSVDPSILNTRGIVAINDIPKVEPTNTLSPAALLFPASTNDDSKRSNFCNIQSSHVLPTKNTNVCRIRTGFERVMSQYTSDLFAGTAKQDGVVSKIATKEGIMKVDYKDGSSEIFQIGTVHVSVSGFMATHVIRTNVEEGAKVKAGDIVCYNSEFFKKDPISGTIDYSIGLDANVLLMESDATLEDSNAVSKSFADRLVVTPTMVRTVELTADCIVHDIAGMHTHVRNIDPLIVFEPGETEMYGNVDDELADKLSQLNRRIPTAKHNGEIVRIEAYYACPLSEMHPSLRKIVQNCIKLRNAQSTIAKGTIHENEYIKSDVLPVGTKYKGVTFMENTVMLQFYIQHDTAHDVGSKLIIANQLKSVTMEIMDHAPYSESGAPIDCIYSSDRIAARTVLSPYLIGSAARVLERLEEQIIDEYFKDE